MSGWAYCSLSWTPGATGDSQVLMRQNEPVSLKLAALTAAPVWPSSPVMPDSALSNLLTISICRTPMRCARASALSIESASHCGTLALTVQPKGIEVSMPMITASLPWLMTRRASHGLVTMRYHPLPGPPYCASM